MTEKEKIEIVADLKDLISGKMTELTKQMDRFEGSLQNINKTAASSNGIMGQVVGANLLTGAISRAGSALYDFGKSSIEAYGKQEQFQVALTTLLYGNAQQAEALNNQLKQFSLETPFELSEIQQSTRLMIAYGSSAANVVDEMRMLGDVASGTAQPLNEVAYLYGTIRQQQKANLIDLRQFANRGIPIFQELAKVTKYTLQQLVEGGKDIDVTFKDVEKAFKNMTAAGSQFGGMMEKQSKTLLGQTSNLSDAWEQLKVSIGDSQNGILKSTVEWATKMVKEMGRIVDRENFTKSVLANLPDNLFNDKRDLRYSVRELSGGTGSGTTGEIFKTMQEAIDFIKKDKIGKYENFPTPIYGKEQSEIFAGKMYEMSKNANKDNARLLMKALNLEAQEIISKSKSGEISPMLASTELAAISKNMKMFKEMVKMGAESKDKPTPAKLEDLAKQNKATQLIVNIENLVREYTNNNYTLEDARRLTVEWVSKALTGAVNDFSVVVGHG